MAGGCLGYHCVGGRQNSPGKGNGKTEYIFFFIYLVLTDLYELYKEKKQ
jgi:hypothetical protein